MPIGFVSDGHGADTGSVGRPLGERATRAFIPAVVWRDAADWGFAEPLNRLKTALSAQFRVRSIDFRTFNMVKYHRLPRVY